jgi:hypothetical protein
MDELLKTLSWCHFSMYLLFTHAICANASNYYCWHAGPPNAPRILFVNSSLYISAFSHVEFPVHYYDVEATDITGIPSDLTGRYNATRLGALHLPITSSPTPNGCLPVRVSASATNAIGTSASASAHSFNLGEY